jgi:hypothetical protein
MSDDQWAASVAAAYRPLRELALPAAQVLILDCSAVPPKLVRSALAAVCAARQLVGELKLIRVVRASPPAHKYPSTTRR